MTTELPAPPPPSTPGPSSWKDQLTRHWKWILLAVLGLAIGVPLLDLVFTAGIAVLWNGYVDSIRDITGINQYLIALISCFLFYPFYLGVRWTFSIRSGTRNKGYATLAAMLGIYYGLLYVATQNMNFDRTTGESTRYWCKGRVMYDGPGIDPVYGCRLRALNPEEIERRIRVTDAEPRRLSSEDELFDRATGEAKAWYVVGPGDRIEVWDQPGFTRTGEELQAVTSDIVRRLRQQEEAEHNAEVAKRQAEDTERRRKEEAQRAEQNRIKEEKEQAQAKARAETQRLRGAYDEAMQRAAAETGFWDEWVDRMAASGNTFRPQITATLAAAKSSMKRCSSLMDQTNAPALSTCLATLKRQVAELHASR